MRSRARFLRPLAIPSMTVRPHPHAFGAAFALISALLWTACGGGGTTETAAPAAQVTEDEEPRRQAVVIGIDGADWRVIERLAAEGGMRNLMGLRERGVWGPIETLSDIALSPVIWTSVATGKTASKHGIAWFMVDRPDGTRVPVRSTNRKTEAIWNILAKNDMRAKVVGWWASFPAEDVGEGVIVSDGLGFHGFGSTTRGDDDRFMTYPSSLFATMDALVPPEQQVPADFVQRFVHLTDEEYREEMFDPARFPRRNAYNPIHLFQQYVVTAQGYTSITEEILGDPGYDLFMVYFEQVDSFSHLFMKYAPPKLEWIDDEGFERYKDVVHEWYEYQDELLGRVLAKIDLETTAVFVLSDHGFKSGDRRIRSEEIVDVRKAHLDHESDGIFIAAGPHVRQGGRVEGASVLDLTPTVLHYLGLPVGKDMDGKVLEHAFEDDFRTGNPIRYVSTHESGERTGEGGTEEFDADDLAEIESGLAALGYADDGAVGGEGEAGGEAGEAEASSPEMHNNMGRIHLREGDTKKALAEFQAALELDPNSADALLNISSIHQAEGRSDLALHFVQRALQGDPNSIGALSQLAELQRDKGDLDEAIRLFDEALAIDDSQPFLYMGYGDVLQRAGHYEAAEAAFKSVLELEPDSFKARYNLGVTYSNMGRIDDALAMYADALEVDPKHPETSMARNNMGAILLNTDEDKALEHFEAAVADAPYHLEALFNTAIIYLSRGRVDEAIEHLEAAQAQQPNHEQVNERLGMAYVSVGRGEDAYRCFLLVHRLYPANWNVKIGLAALHAGGEDLETARTLLSEALKLGGDAARARAMDFPVLQPLLEEE